MTLTLTLTLINSNVPLTGLSCDRGMRGIVATPSSDDGSGSVSSKT